jgi:hypothetical protein
MILKLPSLHHIISSDSGSRMSGRSEQEGGDGCWTFMKCASGARRTHVFATTDRRDFAADLLQIIKTVIAGSISGSDCRLFPTEPFAMQSLPSYDQRAEIRRGQQR